MLQIFYCVFNIKISNFILINKPFTKPEISFLQKHTYWKFGRSTHVENLVKGPTNISESLKYRQKHILLLLPGWVLFSWNVWNMLLL